MAQGCRQAGCSGTHLARSRPMIATSDITTHPSLGFVVHRHSHADARLGGGIHVVKLPKWAGMSDLFWLSEAQVDRLQPFFPKSRGKPRVDDRRVLSGLIFFQRNGLIWKLAPAAYGPPKTVTSVKVVQFPGWPEGMTRRLSSPC